MRNYVAGKGDTLRLVARHYGLPLHLIERANPQLQGPDRDISGQVVSIPEQDGSQRSQQPLPFCDFGAPEETLDHWVPLTPLSKMAETEYDVLIIGSGAGGSAALWRLCEKLGRNKRIGVIERGGLLLPTHALNVPTISNWPRMVQYYFSPNVSDPIGEYLPEYPGGRLVYALGGRTLFWGFTSVRIPAFEFVNWPITYKELEPYYNIAEQALFVSQAETPVNQLLLRRLWEGGYPESKLTPNAIAHGSIDEHFSSIHLIGGALRTGAFDLAVHSRAVQIMTEEGKATGVKVMSRDQETFELKAKNVIVAASTFETPRLLLYSGIQGRAIGHYLLNHAYLKSDGSVKINNDVGGEISLIVPQTEDRPYQFKITGGDSFISFDISGRIQSRYENYVSLDYDHRDSYGVPRIQVRFAYSETDHDVIRLMDEALRKVAATMEATVPSYSCIWPPGYDSHDAGTCRMGDDPSTSATNRYGEIHGVSGLFVADSSVMPTTGAVNPMLTTVALAIRTADHIISRIG